MANGKTDAAPDDIVAEIEATRERLAHTIDSLVDRTNPKNVANRAVQDIKARFINPDGSPRLETIVPVAGGVAGFLGLVFLIRKLVKD